MLRAIALPSSLDDVPEFTEFRWVSPNELDEPVLDGGPEIATFAAAESSDPETAVTKAANSVIWRILIFYVLSVFLLVTIVPWNNDDVAASPFVAAFTKMGIPYADHIMNAVVLTAALSCLFPVLSILTTVGMLAILVQMFFDASLRSQLLLSLLSWAAVLGLFFLNKRFNTSHHIDMEASEAKARRLLNTADDELNRAVD
jgi:L-asparagine transporter-like permease